VEAKLRIIDGEGRTARRKGNNNKGRNCNPSPLSQVLPRSFTAQPVFRVQVMSAGRLMSRLPLPPRYKRDPGHARDAGFIGRARRIVQELPDDVLHARRLTIVAGAGQLVHVHASERTGDPSCVIGWRARVEFAGEDERRNVRMHRRAFVGRREPGAPQRASVGVYADAEGR